MCNRLGLRKQLYLDTKLQVGKKIMCQLFYQFTGSVIEPSAIKDKGSTQEPSLDV